MNEVQITTIKTDRLIMRPFTLKDAPEVQRLANDWEVANTLEKLPHPYKDGFAEAWIKTHQEQFTHQEAVHFAITLREKKDFIGTIGLEIDTSHERGELGYWIGKIYWNNSYCTEAAKAVIDYGFKSLELNRIFARHMTRNPASGRVLQKSGMQQEGHLRQHQKVRGNFEDYELYGMLKAEYFNQG